MKTGLAIFLVSLLLLAGCAANRNAPLANLFQQAESGDADSQYRLGVRYTNGSGVTQNYATAAHWLALASAQGQPNAEYLLAIAYSTGRGVSVDQERALELYIRSAETGHMRSQYQLGEAYANGRGTIKDLAWASRWYEKAALQKHPEALFSLGVFRAAGLDGAADPEQSWIYLQLASDLKHLQAAAVRDRITTKLSVAGLSRARHRVANWTWSDSAGFADIPTVRYVQRTLNILGFSAGAEDGLVGPKTIAAVSKFRNSNASHASPLIDPKLLSLLRTALGVIKVQ